MVAVQPSFPARFALYGSGGMVAEKRFKNVTAHMEDNTEPASVGWQVLEGISPSHQKQRSLG